MAKKPQINKFLDNYKILNVLGHGCFGHVVRCLKQDTKETVAVKVLKLRHSPNSNIREVFILEKLRCLDPDKSNIVRCLEWFQALGQTFMVFEKLDMSLFEYMCQRKWVPMPLNGLRTIISDVATALNVLKGVGLIHTDLKLDNIMLVHHQNQPFRVKVIDFGLTLMTSEAWPQKGVQPLWHRSPEIILGLSFTEAIDIWSLGSVMAEMLLGFPLFPGRTEYDTLRFITDLLGEPPKRLLNGGMNTGRFYHGSRKFLMLIHWTLMTPTEFHAETGIEPVENRRHKFSSLDELKTLSVHQKNSADAAERNACVELLKEMLQMEPRNRITPNNILAHPFITGSNLSTGNSCHNETLAAETSGSQTITNKDPAETKVDVRCPIQLPVGVIMVLPAEKTPQREEATTQSGSISPKAVQINMTNPQKAEDDRDHILEPVNVTYSDLVLESFSDSVETSSSMESDITKIPSVPPNSCVEDYDGLNSLHVIEREKKEEGIQGFFFTLKRSFFFICCVSEDNDE